MEVAVISSSGENVSSSIWNPFANSLLASYSGGGNCSPHGLAVSSGYVISNEKNKPMLHAWPLNKQHFINKRMIGRGKITCVAVSPDGCYIALSIECHLHVYMTSSGTLCGTGMFHLQPINVIKFNSDGTFIGCGGEDGVLSIWSLVTLVRVDDSKVKDPFMSVPTHRLPIKDLVFTSGDIRSRIITVSLDRSCKMHEVRTKNRLYSGNFDNQLTSVALCPRESAFYVGDESGNIRVIDLLSPPRTVDNHFARTTDPLLCAKVHSAAVTSLSVSLDCSLLLSGSNDSTVKLIHIKSRQCLQTIDQKGPVTNCFFYVLPYDCFSTSFKPPLELHDFTKKSSVDSYSFSCITESDIPNNFETPSEETASLFTTENVKKTSSSLSEVDNLKSINDELYSFALEKLLKGSHLHQAQIEPEYNKITAENNSKVNSNKKRKKKK